METKIIPLSEGVFTVGRDKEFHPFDLENDILTDRSTGSLLVEVQPFAIVNAEDVILLDCGLGFNHPTGNSQLINNLTLHDIQPEDVTMVLLSHLHKDHSGGLDINAFPNATFYIYRREYEYALEVGKPSYFPEDLAQLEHAHNVEWLHGAQGSIKRYIAYEHSGGHSREHIVFKIFNEDGSIIFYGGDEAPQYKQVKTKYVAKYDYDGKKAMDLRQKWAQEAADHNWTMLFYHDIQKPTHTF